MKAEKKRYDQYNKKTTRFHKIKVNDVELYYEMHGIIFVHGWMDDCSAWNSQIDFFAKNYKVITYDHRGHGRSDKPKGGYSIQALS